MNEECSHNKCSVAYLLPDKSGFRWNEKVCRGWSETRFELSQRLDSALYRNVPSFGMCVQFKISVFRAMDKKLGAFSFSALLCIMLGFVSECPQLLLLICELLSYKKNTLKVNRGCISTQQLYSLFPLQPNCPSIESL